LSEVIATTVAVMGVIMLVASCALFYSSLTVKQENLRAFFYVQVLEDSGVNVTFVESLVNVDNINATLNPLAFKIPANYSLTTVDTFGTLDGFLHSVKANSINNVYFAWRSGQWTLAYLQLHTEYQGVEISSYSENV
jgi:hypothetical protein